MNAEQRRRLLATPYRLGGRTVGEGIDCLGVVLVLCTDLGLPLPDPWTQLRAAWRSGTVDTASGFPAGWTRVQGQQPATGDVLLYHGEHPWAAIVADGMVWSADAYVGGPYCKPLVAWKLTPIEVWRYDQAVGATGPAR